MSFSFSAAFEQGSNTFKTRYGALLGAVVVFILVMLGAGIVQAIVNAAFGLGYEHDSMTIPDLLITIFFSNVFGPGIFLMAVQLHRGESPGMGTLFAGFSRYWPLVGIGVLLSLIFGAIAIGVAFFAGVGMLTSSADGLALGGGFVIAVLVGLCLSLFFMTRLAFVGILCIDPQRQLGVADSFATSWRMTGPIFWPLLGLIIVLSLILIVSIALLVLPVVFIGAPLFLAVLSAAYQLAVGDAPAVAVEGGGEEFAQG
ncbi:MAG: hypothetical protein QF360_09370 [Phycisphaerales bacterium]|nr:hypothetical protein [Phycisphaerales bacterium]|tara:strand:- start:83 stop:853 length:771 start_codon:yes stop_codon:yes gene_type:complete